MSKTRTIPGALRRRFVGALAAMPVVMLAACGGGGGGGGDIAPPPAVSALVITSANAKPVSADALANSTDTTAATSSAALVTGAQVETGSGASAFRVASVARTLAAKVSPMPALAVGGQTTQTMQCSLGGSMTVSANIASSNALTAGDTMTISAASCKESVAGSAETISGQLSITIVSGGFSGTSTTYPVHLVMRVDSTALSLLQGGTTAVVNGDLTLDINESSSTAATYTVSGSSLAYSLSTASGSRSFTMKNYSQTLVDNAGASSFSVTASVETTNSRLGAGTFSYSVNTPANLTTDSSGAYTGGSLKVTGSNSALLLTVTGANQFQIQVDANGDGAYESTTTATRTELESLL